MADEVGGEQETVELLLDLRVYDLNTAQKCAVVLSGVGTFNFRFDSSDKLIVVIGSKDSERVSPRELSDKFLDELLDQRMRTLVATETKVERDLILAYAFSNTKLLG